MVSIKRIEPALKDLMAWKRTRGVDSDGAVLETARWLLKVLKELHDKFPGRAFSLSDLLARSCGDLFYHPGDSDRRVVYFKEREAGLFIRKLTVQSITRLLAGERISGGTMTIPFPVAMVPIEGFLPFSKNSAAFLKVLLTLAPDYISNTTDAYRVVCEGLARDIAALEAARVPRCDIVTAMEHILSGKRSTRAAWKHTSSSPNFVWRRPSGELRRVEHGKNPSFYTISKEDAVALDWILLDATPQL